MANKDKKPGFLTSFTSSIDDVMSEIKADIQAMTPPDQSAEKKKAAERAAQASKLDEIIRQGASGLAETTIDAPDLPPLPPEPENLVMNAPVRPVPLSMPPGNLWHALRNPELSYRLRGDTCYHALSVPDVQQYERALANEKEGPFTMGVAAVNLSALTDEEVEEGSGPDLLTQALLELINGQPRLYGAVGAGPRQLWSNMDALDEHLTGLLNDNPKLVMLGPVGLDEAFAPYTMPQQQAQLMLQLEIAADFNLPVLLSVRKSHAAMTALLNKLKERTPLPKLIFIEPLQSTEDVELANQFSMAVMLRPELTVPNFAQADAYKALAENRILLGSGSALVAPHGMAGHFNQPKFLQNTLATSAKILSRPERALLTLANRNFTDLFPQL